MKKLPLVSCLFLFLLSHPFQYSSTAPPPPSLSVVLSPPRFQHQHCLFWTKPQPVKVAAKPPPWKHRFELRSAVSRVAATLGHDGGVGGRESRIEMAVSSTITICFVDDGGSEPPMYGLRLRRDSLRSQPSSCISVIKLR
ncbi:hypothetical protein RIF29_17652 [Crotalaria pallida]|uniref:Uncharacterized protein n=1 Tax=Crotalaria pallida TaxID=3830 RepID=A0AAN9FHG1_CROPI